ncbi:hypothetical protein [Saccharomonospora saliphila]|uniref:hypothetical protein n=1 Tax=Saccharomonospora saliphila TaxID=369829 RepID=UPI0003750C70|nr:hypothetical protein [Saccharomonospora saliphila]
MTDDNNGPTDDNESGRPRGSMRFQDAESTTPRQPSLAEQRARRQAEEQERQRRAEEAEAADRAARKAESRRKLLIGSGVTVGLVGFIAGFYVVAAPEEVTAVCVDENGTVVDDDYCDDDYASSHGGYHSGGIVFLPSPGGGDYRQYRYNYGGSGSVGSKVQGGSFTRPSNAEINTRSGSTVQRGGFGISGGSFGKGGGS